MGQGWSSNDTGEQVILKEIALQPQAIQQLSKEMADNWEKYSALKAEFKQVSDTYRTRLKGLLHFIDDLAHRVSSGTDTVRLRCKIEINRDTGFKTITRLDNGEKWEEPLTPEEMQGEMFPAMAAKIEASSPPPNQKMKCTCPIVGYDVEEGATWGCEQHGPMMRGKHGRNIERPPEPAAADSE